VLQCGAVCCSVLQCGAVCCSVVQCVAVSCSVLQCVAVCCNVMQCVAACCTVLKCVAVWCSALHCVAVCCSVLQRVWGCYNGVLLTRGSIWQSSVLQCNAVYCNVSNSVSVYNVVLLVEPSEITSQKSACSSFDNLKISKTLPCPKLFWPWGPHIGTFDTLKKYIKVCRGGIWHFWIIHTGV